MCPKSDDEKKESPSIDSDVIKRAIDVINKQRDKQTHTITGGGSSSYLGSLLLAEYVDQKGRDILMTGKGYAAISEASIKVTKDDVVILLKPRYRMPGSSPEIFAKVPLDKFIDIANSDLKETHIPKP
ncbi:MAG: hypothetical protein ACYCQI_00855 [Gammaproteobacteria bacterium]